MPASALDILRLTCRMSWDGEDVQNVFHLRMVDTTTETDAAMLSDLADYVDEAYSHINQAMPIALTFDSINLYNLTAERFMGEQPWPVLTAGTLASNTSLPPQTAALVRFTTNTLRSQGRKFLPPFGEVHNDGDDGLTAGAITAIALWAADFVTDVFGFDWSAAWGNYNAVMDRWAPWITALINTYYATQRRRRKGVGG